MSSLGVKSFFLQNIFKTKFDFLDIPQLTYLLSHNGVENLYEVTFDLYVIHFRKTTLKECTMWSVNDVTA